MSKPFDYGFDIIIAGIKRYNDEKLDDIYFFGTPNSTNEKYKTASEFKNTIIVANPTQDKTADEIKEEIKTMMDSFDCGGDSDS